MEPEPNILILCTGNATRSVIAGAVLKAHLPHVDIATGGTMSIDGLPMSWRTRAGFEAVGVPTPSHRSRQVLAPDLDQATLIIGLAPEHVYWVRREHPSAAARTVTLKRLVRDLPADNRPLAERVRDLDLAAIELQPWEEVVDPGGGEVEAFVACAEEIVPLVADLAVGLRLSVDMAGDWSSEDWTGERATRWVEMADAVEGQLAPVSAELFDAAALQPGERVLDVGCGTGPTTRRAAELVAPDGHVVGADIAPAMIAAAAERTTSGAGADGRDGAAPVEWVTGDVTTMQPDGVGFDAVISRFGVMFFEQPETSFANLAALTAPGGRLCVAVWAGRGSSAVFEVPLAVVVAEMEARGLTPEVPPSDGGPFSLGEPEPVIAMLERAGWRNVAWTRREVRLPVGGGRDPEGAAEVSMLLGPTRIVSLDSDPAVLAEIQAAVATRLADFVDESGHVVLDATIGIITATR